MSIGACLFMIGFAVVWTCIAIAAGARFMAPFGLLFIGFGIVRLVIMLQHAKERHTDRRTPENRYAKPQASPPSEEAPRYCPFCGARAGSDFKFCEECGRQLPTVIRKGD